MYRTDQVYSDDGEEKEGDDKTVIVYSATPIGDMVDFLKANPYISMYDYIYKMSIAKILMMSNDFTHTVRLTDAQYEQYKLAQAPQATDAVQMMAFFNR